MLFVYTDGNALGNPLGCRTSTMIAILTPLGGEDQLKPTTSGSSAKECHVTPVDLMSPMSDMRPRQKQVLKNSAALLCDIGR